MTHQEIQKVLNKTGFKIEANAKANLTNNRSVKTGHLRRGIATDIGNMEVTVHTSNIKYARGVEEGTKAHIIRPKNNSLNVYRQPLNRCQICGYSSISPESTPNVCPVCGSEMQKIKICSPLGFCVDYNMPVEDFNGSYDWYSPNSDIKLDCEQSLQECPQVNNMTIRNNIVPSQGLVHLVNDNNGDFYTFFHRRMM